jgi:hypothetical protein
VEIGAQVAPRLRRLLDQLTRQPPAATAEVEYVADRFREIWIDEVSCRIVECRRIGWADELAHLLGWNGQVHAPDHNDSDASIDAPPPRHSSACRRR